MTLSEAVDIAAAVAGVPDTQERGTMERKDLLAIWAPYCLQGVEVLVPPKSAAAWQILRQIMTDKKPPRLFVDMYAAEIIRKRQGLTISQFCERYGLDRRHYKISLGRDTTYSVKFAEQLRQGLGLVWCLYSERKQKAANNRG